MTPIFRRHPTATDLFAGFLPQNGQVEVIKIPGGVTTFSRKAIRQIEELLPKLGLSKENLRVVKNSEEEGSNKQQQQQEIREEVITATGAKSGDLLLFLSSVPQVNVQESPSFFFFSFLKGKILLF